MAIRIFYYIISAVALSNQIFPQPLSWRQLHAPVASAVTGITQLSNGEFYLSTSTLGVFKSTDNGATWSECNTGLTNLYINNIYSVNGDQLFACSGATIFKFNHPYGEWINLNAPQASYVSIIVNSAGHIIAGSNHGIFRSTNEGTTWQAATINISASCFISIQNDILFAGANSGVYKSTDNGDTWTKTGISGDHMVSDLCVDNNGDIYANVFFRGQGIYRSQNQGATWEQLNAGLINQLTTSVAVDDQGNIYAGTAEGGVFLKAFDQSSFIQINLHQVMSQVLSIYIAQDKTIYICSAGGGLFRKNQSVSEWKQANSGLPLDHSIPLGFDSNNNFYMGNYYSGFFRSTDDGNNWFPVAYYFGGSHHFSFLAHKNYILLGPTVEFAFWGMLYKSTDRGESWEYFHQGIPLIHPDYPWIQVVMDIAVNSSGDLFAALDTKGIYRRLASDTSWYYKNSDIPDTNVFSVCVDANDNVFAGYRNGYIYKSSNKGENWVESLSDIPGYTVEHMESAGEYVFAILHNWNYPHQNSSLGLYSHDNGNSWLNLNIGSLGSRINSIGFFNNNIVVGSDSDGVFISADFGENWLSASAGLSDHFIKSIIVNLDGILLCGTEKEGIYFADLTTTGVYEIDSRASTNYLEFQNYPNPFNGTSVIRYSVPQLSTVIIKVFDIIGNELETLINEKKPAGSYELTWNAKNLPSGVYFCRMSTASYNVTRKMILIK